MLRASPEPPEVKAQQQEAERVFKKINQGKLSRQQKRSMLLNHRNPRIRAKAQQAVKDQPSPKTSKLSGASVVSEAQEGFSVTLTPSKRFSRSPYAYLNFYGAKVIRSDSGLYTYVLEDHGTRAIGINISRPYAKIYVEVPQTGWYLIDFYGYGKNKARLRILGNGYPTLETWEFGASPTFYNHYATAEYLEEGGHTFYFQMDTILSAAIVISNSFTFFEVSVESF
jgi:hypothetical protein